MLVQLHMNTGGYEQFAQQVLSAVCVQMRERFRPRAQDLVVIPMVPRHGAAASGAGSGDGDKGGGGGADDGGGQRDQEHRHGGEAGGGGAVAEGLSRLSVRVPASLWQAAMLQLSEWAGLSVCQDGGPRPNWSKGAPACCCRSRVVGVAASCGGGRVPQGLARAARSQLSCCVVPL